MATKTSAIITSATTVNGATKLVSKAITDINPNADNGAIKALCEGLAGLTNNETKGIQRVDKTDITNATDGGGGSGGTDGNYTIYYRGDALQATGDSIVGLFKVADSRANQLQGKYFDIKAINQDFNGGTNQGTTITSVSGYKVKGMTLSGSGTNTITINFASDFSLVDNDDEEIFDMQINVAATETYAATTLHYYIFTDPANVEAI